MTTHAVNFFQHAHPFRFWRLRDSAYRGPARKAERRLKVRFDVRDAEAHPELARYYFDRKHACYSRFGVAIAASPLPHNVRDGRVQLIVAVDCASQQVIGGISLFRRTAEGPLPIETALSGMSEMRREFDSWEGRHIVEISGMWTEEAWRKTGISQRLMHMAMATAHTLQADKIVAFGHHHMLALYETLGLVAEPSVEKFHYPNPDYVTALLWADPIRFSTVPRNKRRGVFRFARAIAAKAPVIWHASGRLS